jgi:O-antigen/teichoic acid export membrane protein
MLFKHTSIYILAKAIPGIMAFAALSLYTHLLTPDEYGLYTLIFSASIFVHNVLFNWLPAGTLRFWSKQEYGKESFISTIANTYLKLFMGLIVIIFVSAFFFWGTDIFTWIVCSIILTTSVSVFTLSQDLMSAQIEPIKFAKLSISYSILALIFGGLMANIGYGSIGVILGISIGLLIPTFFAKIDFWTNYKRKSFNKELFKKIAFYGLPLASASLLEEVTKSADRFMLASLQDKAQAGLYAVGYDLSGNSILLLMSAINLAAYPVVIKLLDTEGKEAALDYFYKYAVLLLGISIPAVFGLILVGPNLIHLLIGEEYQQAVSFLLPWIAIALLMMGLQVTYFDLAFQLGHYTMGIVKLSITIAVINVALNYYLIPIMAMKGAAIATLISFIIGTILSAIIGQKHFALPFPVCDFIKIIIATLCMSLLLWGFKDNRGWFWLVLQLLTGLVSYGIVIYAFNILDIRNSLREYINKTKVLDNHN